MNRAQQASHRPVWTFLKKSRALTACSLFLAAMATPYAAFGNNFNDRQSAFQHFQQANPGLEGKDLKMGFHQEWQSIRHENLGLGKVAGHNGAINESIRSVGALGNIGDTAAASILLNNAADRLSRAEIRAGRDALKAERREFQNLANVRTTQTVGISVVGVNNLSIDLGSAVENITLGSKLFKGGGTVTITVGNEQKTLAAGAKVTAAEYVAAKQVLTAGGQKVTIDGSGTAVGGSVDLSALTAGNKSMRVDDLKITEGVTAYGDFGKGGDVRISGDLVNSGGIVAYSSEKNVDVANLRADNIVNAAGASITSGLNSELGGVVENVGLGIYANNNLTNAGTINSAGLLTLSAGNILSNSGAAVAQGAVNLQAPNVINTGAVTSVASNINLDSSIASTLNVTNTGGTLNALDGAINIRSSQFNDAFDTNVIGGDLSSKEVNINSGNGLATVNVGQMTGTVNASGLSAHVYADTDTLVLGEQCLTGDPTYYSTGNIILTGDLAANENIAILAVGNITSTSGLHSIQTNGNQLIMVAGAALSGVGPQFPTPATSNMSVSGANAVGGKIDLTASSDLAIDTTGGRVTLIAYEGSGGGGNVLLSSTSSISVTGGNNSVSVFADASTGTAISLGSVSCGEFSPAQRIYLSNSTAISSDSLPVVFNTTGDVVSDNFFVSDEVFGTAGIQVASMTGKAGITIEGGNIRLGSVNMSGFEFNVQTAGNFTLTDDVSFTRSFGPFLPANINITAATVFLDATDGTINFTSGGSTNITTTVGGIQRFSNAQNNFVVNSGNNFTANLASVGIDVRGSQQVSITALNDIDFQGVRNIDLSRDYFDSADYGITLNAYTINVGNLNADNSVAGKTGFIDVSIRGGDPFGTINVGNISNKNATGFTNAGYVTLDNHTGGTIAVGNIDSSVSSGNAGVVNINGTGNVSVGGVNAGHFGATTDGTITLGNDLTADNDVDIRASTLNNAFAMKANEDINIVGNSGSDLRIIGAIDPGAATYEALGGPITITAPSNNLVLENRNTFKTTATLSASGAGQSINAVAGSVSTALETSYLNTTSLTGSGSFVTIGSTWFLGAPNTGTLVNGGDVTLTGNFNLSGADFAIISSSNINLAGATIDLGGADSGNLTMFAGFNFNPSGGSVQHYDQTTTFQNFSANATGGSILGGANINLNGTVNGGDLVALANAGTVNAGTIALGNISNIGQNSGDIRIHGEGGVTLGNVTSVGSSSSGEITITTQRVVFSPDFTITNGSISSGAFGAIADPVGTSIVTGNITNGPGGIVALAAGAAGEIHTGVLNIGSVDLSAGTVDLGATNTLAATGANGSVFISAATLTNASGHLQISALGNAITSGGTITYVNTGTSAVTIGSAPSDSLEFDVSGLRGGFVNLVSSNGIDYILQSGAITGTGSSGAFAGNANGSLQILTAGNITVNAGSINLSHVEGGGSSINLSAGSDGDGTLLLNDTTFLSAGDANGGDYRGGSISLNAAVIGFASSLANPLALSAKGSGTGNGGNILYVDRSSTATIVGSGSAPKKGPVNFLTLDASSGLAGGNGGRLDVEIGGNLTINAASFKAGPSSSSGDWNGASYTAIAGQGLSGNLLINGSLNANGFGAGDSGQIILGSNSKTAFSINPSKAPKANGISGNLVASDNGGSIRIFNNNGGILVGSTGALVTQNLELSASGAKGNIAAVRNVVLASGKIVLTATSGSIGGKTPLTVSTHDLTVNTAGLVGIRNFSDGNPLRLRDSIGGRGFTLTNSGGEVELQNLSTTTGSIAITTGGGLLVTDGSQITANNGSLLLRNDNVSDGSIVLGDNSIVETRGTKGGNTTIVIGEIVKKGTNTTPPGGVSVDLRDKGLAFFGTGSLIVDSVAQVNAFGKNVIFNNAGFGGSIRLGDNVTVTADPPPKTVANAGAELFGFYSEHAVNTADLSVASIDAAPALQQSKDANNANLLTAVNSNFAGSALATDANKVLPSTTFADDDSYVVGRLNAYSDTEASLCSDLGFVHGVGGKGQALSHVNLVPHAERVVFNHGNVLMLPQVDTVVETPQGNVSVAGKSVVLISMSNAGLAVFDFDDQHKGSVSVESNGHSVVLSPGRHVLVTPHHAAAFAQINAIETIAHRNVGSSVKNGFRTHVSEFSIPSALDTVKPLRAMVLSNHPEAKKVAARMMKTTAVVMQLGGGAGEYQHYFKPRMSAMAVK